MLLDDLLIRMQKELACSLTSSAPIRWGMVIDVGKCLGCHACTVACMSENALPHGIAHRPVQEVELGTFPHVSRSFYPNLCMHCAKPVCVSVCPVKATWQEEKYGITLIDDAKCIGCAKCSKACPYGGRQLGKRKQQQRSEKNIHFLADVLVGTHTVSNNALSSSDYQKKQKLAYKCHFCLPRLNKGRLPACVTACIGRATFFGNLNDSHALVSTMAFSAKAWQVHPELGTEPYVFYHK